MNFLTALQESAFSYWLSTSILGVPTLMALHSVGMAIVVGLALIAALRLHGLLDGIDRKHLPRLLKIAAWGFLLNLVTGIGIFISRAPDYIASYLFLFKLLLVLVSAMLLAWLGQRLQRSLIASDPEVADRTARAVSLIVTAILFGAVLAGRLLAYLTDLY